MQVPSGVETWLSDVRAALGDNHVRANLVTNAVRRTIADGIDLFDDGTAFVRTGDIPAMWLRDSTAQVRPLLAAAHHGDVADLLTAVNRRQLRYVTIDPYANAFNAEPNNAGYHRDFDDQSPWVWERKYELDSAAWVFDLAARIYATTGRTDHLDDTWIAAVQAMVELWRVEQDHASSNYRFVRPDVPPHDTLSHDGYGSPVDTTGLVWSGFRPSDDSCIFGNLVPSNAFAAVALEKTTALLSQVAASDAIADECTNLAAQIRAGIADHAVIDIAGHGRVYAYEVDGFGHSVAQDDANIPSLLALPYLGWCGPDDDTYRRTRDYVLSQTNPFYVAGKFAAGVGSAHTPPNNVWPLALAMQGLTSTSAVERATLLTVLEATTADTGYMHESFDVNDDALFTRPWFSWADMTYVELVLATLGMSPSVDW